MPLSNALATIQVSATGFTVAGNTNKFATVLMGVLLLGDPVTSRGALGLFLSLCVSVERRCFGAPADVSCQGGAGYAWFTRPKD